MPNWDNQAIAEKLLELADLLEQQNANLFRVNAYRRAALTVAGHAEELAVLAEREGGSGPPAGYRAFDRRGQRVVRGRETDCRAMQWLPG